MAEKEERIRALKADIKRMKKEMKEIDDLRAKVRGLEDEKVQMAEDFDAERKAMKRLLDNLQKKLKEAEEKLAEQLHLCDTQHDMKKS